MNGFLGAGKTTVIAALARIAAGRGLRCAAITNDQGYSLVDTQTLIADGLKVDEVSGGCFCCRFSDLVLAIDRVLATDAEVVFCEAVGSCTDIVATVLRPLRRFYGDSIVVAPLVAVVDAQQAKSLLMDDARTDLRVLREHQICEADLILLNKTDLVPDWSETAGIVGGLASAPCIPVSARTGAGLHAAADRLLGSRASTAFVPREIDYDEYARAEEMLGWMNATAVSTTTLEGRDLVRKAVLSLGGLAESGDAVHIKARFGGNLAQLTVAGGTPDVTGGGSWQGAIVVNARACVPPERLREAFQEFAAAYRLQVVDIQAFRPSYPHPEYREGSER